MKKASKILPYYLREINEGSVLVVMDGGRVSFEVPRIWIYRVKETKLSFYDREPPENDCILEASLICHPKGPIRGLPVWKMLQDSLNDQGRFIPREEIVEETRGALQIARLQYSDVHPKVDRVAIFCTCIIRGSGFHALLNYAYWPEEAERLAPVWTRAIDTFEIGSTGPNPN